MHVLNVGVRLAPPRNATLRNVVLCARFKQLIAEKAATCISPTSNTYVIQFPAGLNCTFGKSKADFYGNFTVTETIQEPLELIVITNRCNLNMRTCETFNKLTLTRICSYINDDKGIFASFLKSLEPDFRCPIKPGVYFFKNSTIDLSIFTMFPLEGYRWQSSIKLISKSASKKEIYCLNSQASMIWVRKP
ncbi:uncharacterized protein LOC131429273 [Malaya genurostris]|uniref:uncharacterized protein LOC131429273 n=1 Tax=Malaya genurostris TaxID=325434 RepID=UPI0026F3F609|nr:uncharacterized protein LOC131429273 [Malaya genurostris]